MVDLGYVKSRFINEQTGIELLKVMPISKSQANQRAGRAGRECPGICYRIYTEDTYEHQLVEMTVPEIQRMNISQVILQLKVIGVERIGAFPFLSRPSDLVIRNALETLLHLGALDRVSIPSLF